MSTTNVMAELAFCLRNLIDLSPEELEERGLKEDYNHGSLSRHFDALGAYDAQFGSGAFQGITIKTLHFACNAYACIQHAGGTLDVRIEPGKTARQSLLDDAAAVRMDAERRLRRAALMEMAAGTLPA